MVEGTTAVQAGNEHQHRSPAELTRTRRRMPPVRACRATSGPSL